MQQKFNLDPDTKLLMYSYLQLEEFLTVLKDDITTRDEIIKLYHKELPNIDIAGQNGHLETIKYLIEYGIVPTDWIMRWASEYGHLEVVVYLVEMGTVPTNNAIISANRNGHLDMVEYLVENAIKHTVYM